MQIYFHGMSSTIQIYKGCVCDKAELTKFFNTDLPHAGFYTGMPAVSNPG